MQFRWVAFIALWTMISGPILGTPSGPVVEPKSALRKPRVPTSVQTTTPLEKNTAPAKQAR